MGKNKIVMRFLRLLFSLTLPVLFVSLVGCDKSSSATTPTTTSAPTVPVPGMEPAKEPARNANGGGGMGGAPGDADSKATSPSGESTKSDAAPTNGAYRCTGVTATDLVKLDKVGDVRLAGVHTPTITEPGGAWVLEQLKRAVLGIPVEVEFCKKNPNDGRGHYRAIIAYRDTSGKWHNLNQLMVLEGLALANGEDCHLDLRSYDKFQEAAQNLKKGLWKTAWAKGAPAPPGASGAPAPPASAGGNAPMGGPTGTSALPSAPPLTGNQPGAPSLGRR